MIWLRRVLVFLLSLLLFLALLDGVLAASIDIALGSPSKLEGWLNQSGLYSSFVSNALTQANSSTHTSNQSNGVSLSDTAVLQAAESAFSPALIQQDVNIFLNSNYAWLQGKTTTPVFVINLTSAKQNFAQQVGQYVETHVSSLPVCSTTQVQAALQTSDPLMLSCRPSTLNPAAAGAQVSQQLASNNGFLGNTVITANSISPNKGGQSKPYYKQFSDAPRIYQLATKLPWALGVLAALCIAGIIFVSPMRRRGLRKIVYVLFEVGIILIIVKVVCDLLFKKFENKLFNQSSDGPIQHSLTNFAQRLETQINNVNFYFALAMIVLALIIIVALVLTRRGNEKLPPTISGPDKALETNSLDPTQPISNTQATTGSQPPSPAPTRPKRPRLIQ